MRRLSFFVPLSAALLLSACHNTADGMKSDFGKVFVPPGASNPMEKLDVPDGYTGHAKGPVLKPPAMTATETTPDAAVALEPPPSVSAPVGLQPPAYVAAPQPVPPGGEFMTPELPEDRDVGTPVYDSAPMPLMSGNTSGLQWNEIGTYNGELPAAATYQAPVMQAPAYQQPALPSVSYGDSVRVFPLDAADAAAPYITPSYATTSGYQVAPSSGIGLSSAISAQTYGQIVQRIYFGDGSTSVKLADKKLLKDLARAINRTQNDVRVTVVGHSSKPATGGDQVGKKMANFTIAQKRAEAVTAQLRGGGLSSGKIQTVSKGDDEPNMNSGGMRQEDADRRVEVYVSE